MGSSEPEPLRRKNRCDGSRTSDHIAYFTKDLLSSFNELADRLGRKKRLGILLIEAELASIRDKHASYIHRGPTSPLPDAVSTSAAEPPQEDGHVIEAAHTGRACILTKDGGLKQWCNEHMGLPDMNWVPLKPSDGTAVAWDHRGFADALQQQALRRRPAAE